MKNKQRGLTILGIIATVIIVLLIIFLKFKSDFYPLDKEGMVNMYKVNCNTFDFKSNSKNYMYKPGSHVELEFGMIATDTDYSFYAEGVEDYKLSYKSNRGYIIEFEMPANDVKVGYHSRNSMVNEERPPHNIKSLVISTGGGFGSRAGTHRIEIEFIGNTVSLKTTLNEFKDKKETKLKEELNVSSEDIEDLYEFVRENMWDFENNLKENTDILDGSITYITINEKKYGGYMISNKSFHEVINKAIEIVTQDKINEFRNKIKEWFEEK